MIITVAFIFIAGLLLKASSFQVSAQGQAAGYLHTSGNQIVDAAGRPVKLTGINWFGLETPSYAPHGLWVRNWEDILDQIKTLGFNAIRLPYSNQLFDADSVPNGIDYDLNPDLKGLSGLAIMDKIIAGAEARGLKVVLDRHRPDSSAQSDLWYTAQYSEARWIGDWVMLAERYAGNDTVIGVDLHNEPHRRATWGTGDLATDWRLAAERAGNAILEVNPNLLIIVQGVDQYQGDWYWWGGNLIGAREHPVRLNLPDRLVYSTHVYGPGVYPQPWFSDPAFPDNLPGIWNRHWGYLSQEGIAPVVVGEFGGRSVGDDKEGVWQRALVAYLSENGFSYFYWTLNPNSGDTGGLLLDDWKTVDEAKLKLLASHQFPLIGVEDRTAAVTLPAPIATLPRPPATQVPASANLIPGVVRVKYRTAIAAAQARESKPEFVIVNAGDTALPLSSVELRYWFKDDNDQPLDFHCDWAAVGCANVVGDFVSAGEGLRYLRLRFQSGAGQIQSDQDSGEIKVRFNRTDWVEYQQGDDYSFGPVTAYTDWESITLYVAGVRVWGAEPGSVSPPVELTPEPTVAAQPTALNPPESQSDGQTIAAPVASQDWFGLLGVFTGGLALGLGLWVLSRWAKR